MTTRRTSARLSGGSDSGGVATHDARGMDIGRKRIGDELTNGTEKRRKSVKKPPAFKPQQIPIPHSSKTPEDDDEEISTTNMSMSLPPPPSEKKIARRRDSTRAIREREKSPASTNHPPPSKKLKPSSSTHASTSASASASGSRYDVPDPLLEALRKDAPPLPPSTGLPIQVDFLKKAVTSSRHDGPRPTSPPRALPRQSIGTSMAPPTGFVRKTRKSMVGQGGGAYGDLSREAVVPLPEADTPMITKNRDMREAQQRRSSLGLRGQRASSSLGKGEISIPHSSVESEMFYKHIAPTMPEPIRARHLLVYCAKRAVEEHLAAGESSNTSKKKRDKEPERSTEGDRLVSEIMEEFMSGLGKGNIDTNVFSQSAPPARSLGIPLKAHPKNVANRDAETRENNLIKACKAEDTQWKMLVHRTNKLQQSLVPRLREQVALNSQSGSRPDLSGASSWLTMASSIADDILADGEGDLMSMGEFDDVEYKVDLLHSTSHAAAQYSLHAGRFLDGIFNALSADLRNRGAPKVRSTDDTDVGSVLSQAVHTSSTSSASNGASTAGPSTTSSTARGDPMSMLRALASADIKEGSSAEVEEAAARVAPVALGGGGISLGMTPRRVGMTPRRPVAGTTPGGVGAGAGGNGKLLGVTPKSLSARTAE